VALSEREVVVRVPSILRVWGVAIILGGCGGQEAQDPFAQEIFMADRQWGRGDISMARQTVEGILAQDEESFAARYRLGFWFLEDDPSRALEHLERAASLRPLHPGPPFVIGLIRMTLNELEAAEADLRRGFDLAQAHAGFSWPEADEVVRDGLQALREQRYEEAAVLFSRIVEERNDARLWFFHATALRRGGEMERAEAVVDRALERRGDYAEARALKAEILRARGQWVEARRELELALAERPELGAAHFQMGLLLLRESEFRDALLSFWWSLLDDPTMPDVHQYAANALFRMQMGRHAQIHLKHVESVKAFRGRYLKLPGFVPIH
jgi:tetratricopeptide (TPR) repeat protein